MTNQRSPTAVFGPKSPPWTGRISFRLPHPPESVGGGLRLWDARTAAPKPMARRFTGTRMANHPDLLKTDPQRADRTKDRYDMVRGEPKILRRAACSSGTCLVRHPPGWKR